MNKLIVYFILLLRYYISGLNQLLTNIIIPIIGFTFSVMQLIFAPWLAFWQTCCTNIEANIIYLDNIECEYFNFLKLEDYF